MAQRKVNCEVYTDRGIVGKSAYQQAVKGGYQGTEEEFEQALASDISVVADNVTNINAVGNNIENVNTVAGNATNINTVATNISSINTAATNMPAIIAAPTEAANAANSATEASASATIATTQAELAKEYADSIDLSNYRTSADQDIIDATKQDTITDLATIRSGASEGATAVQPGDLATVATSGMYSDLTGTPGAATADTLGLVKPDGNTITVTEDGTISATGGSGSGFDFEGTKAEFDAAVAAGTITEDSVSLITDDVSGDNVATKAELQDRVAKAGDTMTGLLKMSGANEVRFGTDDNYYLIKKINNGTFEIYNKNGKGLFLRASEDHAPFYWDGTNGYRLLTTADLPGNAGSVGFPNLSAPVSYSADVAFTAPTKGWVWTQGYFSAAGGQTVTGTLNGKSFTIGYNASSTYNFDSPLWFPVAKGDVWLCNRQGFFYPMR